MIEMPPRQVSGTTLHPFPDSRQELVNKEVQGMLHLGVIKLYNSTGSKTRSDFVSISGQWPNW